jgi:branched-subunit amino acid aminotransferase/4-amino-4-deoxychorismate lyase
MIPYDDRGLTLGDGLFETVLAKAGELVLFEAHLARMAAGCAVLGLPAPDLDEARRVCEHALVFPSPLAGEGGRLALRLTLTAGSGGRGLDRPAEPQPRLFATSAPSPKPQGPIALTTVSVRRNEGSPASRLKTLGYLDAVLARREAGDGEALMLNNRGEVACAAVANVFWLKDGALFTPALACGVLDGIMRGQTLAAARELGFPINESAFPRSALDEADAVFLTNSLIGLRRVDRLDGKALGDAPQVSALAEALGPFS